MPGEYNLLNQIYWEPSFPEGDSFARFLSGFSSGQKVAGERRDRKDMNTAIDASNETVSALQKFGMAEGAGKTPNVPGNWLGDFSRAYMGASSEYQKSSDPLFSLRQQQQQVNLQSGLLGIEMKRLELGNVVNGQQEVAAWMQETGNNPVYMVNRPYTGVNPVAAEQISDAQLRASQSLLVQKAKQSMTDFNTRLARLPSEAALAIGQMSDDPRTGLPSHAKIRALTVAEEAQNVRARNEAEAAQMAAEARGDLATTSITDRGVATTFRPAPSATAKDVRPRELTMSDGSLIVYNPNTGAFRFKAKTGQEKEMSRRELLDAAKELADADFEDENAKKIRAFLATEAVNQINSAVQKPATQSSPATAPAPQSIKRYNPATGRIE